MPTLVLIRHAKAEAHRPEDFSRHLADKGRGQCHEVRAWLLEHGLEPDRAVVSTSARTRETWELCSTGTSDPVYDGRVYEAAADDLRAVIAETPPEVETLALVGHNPAIEQLAWELDDSAGARDRTNQGMRTAGVAVFSLKAWDAPYGELLDWR